MKFVSLRDLTHKQLIQYGVIGIALGALLNLLFASTFIQILSGAASFLGWVYLIWGIIKWIKERRVRS